MTSSRLQESVKSRQHRPTYLLNWGAGVQWGMERIRYGSQ